MENTSELLFLYKPCNKLLFKIKLIKKDFQELLTSVLVILHVCYVIASRSSFKLKKGREMHSFKNFIYTKEQKIIEKFMSTHDILYS